MSKIKSAEEFIDENYFSLTLDCKREIEEIYQAIEEYADYVLKAKLESITDELEKGLSRNYEEDNYDSGYGDALDDVKQKLLKDV